MVLSVSRCRAPPVQPARLFRGTWHGPPLLTEERPKPYWQRGWLSQHDRLMQSLSAMPGHIPLFVSGDLHAIGEGRMMRDPLTFFRISPIILGILHRRLSMAVSTLSTPTSP